jgi:hypothetical protein
MRPDFLAAGGTQAELDAGAATKIRRRDLTIDTTMS